MAIYGTIFYPPPPFPLAKNAPLTAKGRIKRKVTSADLSILLFTILLYYGSNQII